MDVTNCPNLNLAACNWTSYADTLESLVISYVNVALQRNKVPLDIFSGLKNLKYFQFSDSQLTDDEMWQLPENLESFVVSDNNYTNINLSMCPNLNAIDVTSNMLTRLPILSQPLPSLQSLVLNHNPMDNLTVEHIIPLCKLSKLDFIVPEDSYLSTLEGFCPCFRLKKLAFQLNLEGSVHGCRKLSKAVI